MLRVSAAYLAESLRLFYWIAVRWFVRIMPLKASYWAAGAMGTLMYLISGKRRKRLENGLIYLFGDRDHRKDIRGTFRNYALNSIEVFLYPSFTRENVLQMVDYSGMDHITRALRKGKGVILLHGHFGNEEFLMPAVSFALDTQVNQLASRWEPALNGSMLYRYPDAVRRYAFRMRIAHRESLPINFIYVDRGAKKAYRALQENKILLLAADGREGSLGLEVDFLGRKALYSKGPMRIAHKTGAEVLPVFLVRRQDNKHRMIVEGPLLQDRTSDVERDLLVNTQRFADRLAAYVREYPDHYLKLFWQDIKYFKEYSL